MKKKTKTPARKRSDSPVWLDRALVRAPMYIALCTSEEAYLKFMRGSTIPKAEWDPWIPARPGAVVHFFRTDKGDMQAVVCMKRVPGIVRIQYDAMLVHEAVHIWQRAREELGENAPSSEFEAYAIQNISTQLLKAWHG